MNTFFAFLFTYIFARIVLMHQHDNYEFELDKFNPSLCQYKPYV